MRRETLTEQLDGNRVNSDVARAMKADRAELVTAVHKLLTDAETKYQDAARMHFTSKCSYYGGAVDTLKKVLELI